MPETTGKGRFQATRESFGFVRPDEGGPDLFVPAGETAGALHQDWVEYRLARPARRGQNAEAHVIRILERGVKRLTGVIAGTRAHPILVPDHPRLPAALRLIGAPAGIETGQRVLCRLEDTGGRRGPAVALEEILGDADDPALDVAIVAAEFGLPEDYPEAAAAEARAARDALESAPAAGRRDFLDELTFTVDPQTAADFDDAIGIRARAEGGWRLRVHIADVAEGVLPGGPLDAEARRRGNSTYFPGVALPMLPEVLSNEAMSLSPGSVKRVLTVSALLSDGGALRGARIDEGLIRSDARLTYEQAQAVLDGRESQGRALDAALREADQLAQRLRARRLDRGAFDLQVPETEVLVDDGGRPLEIRRRESGRSHQIIEEFMILANRIACRYARLRGHPYLFRVHDPPDPLALEEFRARVVMLAPETRAADLADLPAMRRWLGGLTPGLRTWQIHGLFLRALKRASYADHDRGHFGLGLQGYGHFTSPIRRYPDLFNHRVVKWSLHHGARPVPEDWRFDAAALAAECSANEERSELAEREIIRLKTLRWAAERAGQSFRGRAVAIASGGIFVELDAVPVDGLVPRAEEVALLSQRTSRRERRSPLALGDPVIVQIARVNLRERMLFFALRAMGRRALELDPEALEAWVDLAPPSTAAGRARGRRPPRTEEAAAAGREKDAGRGRRRKKAGREMSRARGAGRAQTRAEAGKRGEKRSARAARASSPRRGGATPRNRPRRPTPRRRSR